MKFGTLTRYSVVLASFTLLVPPGFSQTLAQSDDVSPGKPTASSSFAATVPGAKPQIKDIALNSAGILILTVLRTSGQPAVRQPLTVYVGETAVVRVITDAKGQVQISGLKPGLHIVETGSTKTPVRFWRPEMAPPHAVRRPAIVDMSDLVRGQYGYGYGAPMAPGLVAATVTAIGVGAVVIGKNSSSGNSSPTEPASP